MNKQERDLEPDVTGVTIDEGHPACRAWTPRRCSGSLTEFALVCTTSMAARCTART